MKNKNKIQIQASIKLNGLTASEKTDYVRALKAGIFEALEISTDNSTLPVQDVVKVTLNLPVLDGSKALQMFCELYHARLMLEDDFKGNDKKLSE